MGVSYIKMENKKNTRLEVYKLIELNKTSKEISELLNISLRTAQTYIKEYKEVQALDANETQTQSVRKKKKEIARAKIITGSSFSEVVAQTGTTIDVCKKLSAKEKLQEAQREFLNRFREEQLQEIERLKRERLKTNKELLEVINNIRINSTAELKNVQETLLKNELTEQEILELSRIERLERLELEKSKLNTDSQDAKLSEILEALEENL